MLYNGIDLTSYFRIKAIRGRGLTNQEISTFTIPGMDGDYVSRVDTPSKILEVDVRISNGDLRGTIDDLNGILATKVPVPIVFPDEPNRTYYGIFEATGEVLEYPHLGIHDAMIIIRRPDPYKYGPETHKDFNGDSTIITNTGTAETDPIFELTVEKTVTFAMVQNQDDEYMMIGEPIDVDAEVVSTRTLLLEERGETLDTWSSTPTAVDGGTVSGSFGYDGTGITVASHGTGSRWRGPALIKEVSPAQDFEVEMLAQGITDATDQTFRMEVYLFDEGMDQLGKMSILDNDVQINKKKVEARVGPFQSHFGSNYLITERNYSYLGARFYGMLRIRRVGNVLNFYVARLDNNLKHIETFSQSFVDGDNQFAGKLKYIQIHTGIFEDTMGAYSSRINSIKAYKLTEAVEDQTPYIAYPNDVITFDHVNDEILINGEDRKDLKDFGSSYFKLAKGANQLIVHPADSFETSAKFRNRYR